MGVSRTSQSRVINGRSASTAEMALRVGKWVRNGPEIWTHYAGHELDLHADHGMDPTERSVARRLIFRLAVNEPTVAIGNYGLVTRAGVNRPADTGKSRCQVQATSWHGP